VQPVLVGEALEEAREAAHRGEPYRMLLLDFDFASAASQRLVSALRGDHALEGLHLALLAPVTARLENGWKAGADRIISLNKPPRMSQLARVIEDCITGTSSWRRRAVYRPAAIPRFAGRVLLVEDNPVNQAVTEGMLHRVGLEVLIKADGSAAVEAVSNQAFDLVLMDVQMPVMDGLDATRAIRAFQAATGVHTTIVALTANAMSQERELCLAAGMDDFLPKPFASHQLHQVLGRWLRSASASAQPGAAAPREAAGLALKPDPIAPRQDFPGAVLDRAALDRIRELGVSARQDLLSKVLQLFLEDAPRHLSAIEQALERRDAPALAASSHSLKSSSGHIGAMRLSAMCAALEKQARATELGQAESLVASLRAEWKAVRSEIESAMAELAT
jgi:CheY-like chemotaxis protein/HPt (histidine-containing phosphotransfer) domain-containing protein